MIQVAVSAEWIRIRSLVPISQGSCRDLFSYASHRESIVLTNCQVQLHPAFVQSVRLRLGPLGY